MNRRKRQQNTTKDYCYDSTKKRFSQIKTVIMNTLPVTQFEDLPNEIIYEIFELINGYDLYRSFSNLNTRFQSLLIHPSLPIHINISSISKSNFEQYYTQHIIPDIHRIKSIHSSNPFTIDLMNLLIFTRLETLSLSNTDSKHLEHLLQCLTSLSNLSSLSISTFNCPSNKNKLYHLIFRLPALKYCKISFHGDYDVKSLPIATNDCSPIEHLVIKTKCHLNQLTPLLSYVPHLRYLSCNDLYICYEEGMNMIFPELNNLTHISLQLYNINFDRFEFLIINLFHQLELLRISTSDDCAYLDASRWERLILDYMPYLRIFDIQHTNFAFNNDSDETACHTLMNHFATQFWFERKWFFAHQHNWLSYLNNAIFYSTQPYRRRYYSLGSHDTCPYRVKNILEAVRHVELSDEEDIINSSIYFPNAAELTFRHSLLAPNALFGQNLNRIVCLTQLNKITIHDNHLNIDQLVEMLSCASNCHTLILYSKSIDKQDDVSSSQNETSHLVSNIKNIVIKHKCTPKRAKLLINMCPQLEHLTMESTLLSLISLVRFLLAKTSTRHLFSLYFIKIGTIREQELKTLINSENLLFDYKIKMMGDNCHLWW